MVEPNFLNTQKERDYEKPLLMLLGSLTILGVLGVSWYVHSQYTQIVSTLDSSVLGILDNNRMEVTLKSKKTHKLAQAKKIACPAPETFTSVTDGTTPVLLFIKQIQEENKSEHSTTPIFELMRKVGVQEPESLTKLGKKDEYPATFAISPDKNLLAINLESKLQIFNLRTKKTHHISFAQRKILTATFSPDSAQLFIVMQDTEGAATYFSVYTLDDCSDKIIYENDGEDNGFMSATWRSDNKIVLAKGYGDGISSVVFDRTVEQFEPVAEDDMRQLHMISANGTYVVNNKEYTEDVCNYFSGYNPSTYSIVDPLQNKEIGVVGSENNYARIVAFSRDNTEVLYTVQKPRTSETQCDTILSETYYKASVATGVGVKVSNLATLLSQWKTDFIGAHIEYGQNEEQILYIQDKPLISSPLLLQIVAQYYE